MNKVHCIGLNIINTNFSRLQILGDLLRTSCLAILLLTVLTGVLYPCLVTHLAAWFFPWEANGSLIIQNQQIIGSKLIGQWFTTDNYFWGRPSAMKQAPYYGIQSTGSNYAPTNHEFLSLVHTRVAALTPWLSARYPLIPVDLVTASASGLDPDISPVAAFFQVERIAQIRNLTTRSLYALIHAQIIPRSFGCLGEPRVNVLQLNLALDNLAAHHGR